jgi:hypothetical protein
LWNALRDTWRGGWIARETKADAWYFVTWAGFIFLFFSASHSKLIPYILPIFPPLAVLIGGWLAKVKNERAMSSLRTGLGVFSFVCGLLAIALSLVVSVPAIMVRVHLSPAQAAAVQPYAFTLSAVLLLGGILTPWLAKTRSRQAALAGMVVTMTLFFAGLTLAMPLIPRSGTKELALIVKARAQPGDLILHYHEFFHDFTFYAERVVGLVSRQGESAKGELELDEDAAARASDRFMDEAEFRRRWTGPGRLWVVADKDEVKELFADPTFHHQLLVESRGNYLFSNQP